MPKRVNPLNPRFDVYDKNGDWWCRTPAKDEADAIAIYKFMSGKRAIGFKAKKAPKLTRK